MFKTGPGRGVVSTSFLFRPSWQHARSTQHLGTRHVSLLRLSCHASDGDSIINVQAIFIGSGSLSSCLLGVFHDFESRQGVYVAHPWRHVRVLCRQPNGQPRRVPLTQGCQPNDRAKGEAGIDAPHGRRRHVRPRRVRCSSLARSRVRRRSLRNAVRKARLSRARRMSCRLRRGNGNGNRANSNAYRLGLQAHATRGKRHESAGTLEPVPTRRRTRARREARRPVLPRGEPAVRTVVHRRPAVGLEGGGHHAAPGRLVPEGGRRPRRTHPGISARRRAHGSGRRRGSTSADASVAVDQSLNQCASSPCGELNTLGHVRHTRSICCHTEHLAISTRRRRWHFISKTRRTSSFSSDPPAAECCVQLHLPTRKSSNRALSVHSLPE